MRDNGDTIMVGAMIDCLFHVENGTTIQGGLFLKTLARASVNNPFILLFILFFCLLLKPTRDDFFMIILMIHDHLGVWSC